MARTWHELRELSDEQVESEYDRKAETTVEGLDYYYRELVRRDQDRQTQAMLRYTQAMLRYTRQVTWMTGVMAVATIVSTIAAVVVLSRQ